MSPFAIPLPEQTAALRLAVRLAAPAVERATGLTVLDALYRESRERPVGAAYFAHALATLGVDLAVDAGDLAHVPRGGPVVVVANHPTGPLDGLAVTATVARARADVRVLGNQLLTRIPEIGAACIAVDVYGGRAAVSRNAAALRRAVRWVRAGHAIVVFPSGSVDSHDAGEGVYVDGPWHPDVARLIALTGAPVVPAYVEARPSRWLRAAGRLHWALRTLSLPRELLRQRGRTVRVRLGGAIATPHLSSRGAAADRIAYLKARTHALAPTRRPATLRDAPPVAAEADAALLEDELRRLPASSRLLDQRDWLVLVAEAGALPNVLAEIGRLREVAFRAEGEGSGRERDLDAYDREYLHLVAWHRGHRRIAGAYRLGPTDRVSPGPAGPRLYTRSLFRYGRPLLDALGPALELGRAFVHPAHQRDYATLLTLWKGIGAFVSRHPRYRHLFGPVSLSADLPLVVRQVIAAALAQAAPPASAVRVAGRHPLAAADPQIARLLTPRGLAIDHDALDALVRELDPQHRPMPVLLRHYLKLGGRVLAFSVDADFAGVVDGFMVVDLAAVPAAQLARYMGRTQADAFLAHHLASPASGGRPVTPAGQPAPAATSPQLA